MAGQETTIDGRIQLNTETRKNPVLLARYERARQEYDNTLAAEPGTARASPQLREMILQLDRMAASEKRLERQLFAGWRADTLTSIRVRFTDYVNEAVERGAGAVNELRESFGRIGVFFTLFFQMRALNEPNADYFLTEERRRLETQRVSQALRRAQNDIVAYETRRKNARNRFVPENAPVRTTDMAPSKIAAGRKFFTVKAAPKPPSVRRPRPSGGAVFASDVPDAAPKPKLQPRSKPAAAAGPPRGEMTMALDALDAREAKLLERLAQLDVTKKRLAQAQADAQSEDPSVRLAGEQLSRVLEAKQKLLERAVAEFDKTD